MRTFLIDSMLSTLLKSIVCNKNTLLDTLVVKYLPLILSVVLLLTLLLLLLLLAIPPPPEVDVVSSVVVEDVVAVEP